MRFLLRSLSICLFFFVNTQAFSSNFPVEKERKIDEHGPVFPLEELVDKPQQNDRFYSELLNMLSTLGLVIAILLIVAWLLRRLMNTRLEAINSSSSIKVIERRALSPKTVLYLLQIEDKNFLLGETQNGVVHLGEYSLQEDFQKDASLPSTFSQILASKKEKKE